MSEEALRIAEQMQAAACPAQESSLTATETYNANNQISDGLHQYDAAGDLIQDGTTGDSYLYDAEGRICAMEGKAPGYTTMTGYLYDADGARVAKGTITTMSCDPTANGFQITEDYVLGPGGEELSMLGPLVNGNLNWQRTNVWAGGKLIGTYDLVANPNYSPYPQPVGASNPQQIPWLHFHLEDGLGTRRMQISGMLANLGQPEMDFQSWPFGDGLSNYPDAWADQSSEQNGFLGATPLFFTGKERDPESGNDYFGARYYASSTGRWLSPDWSSGPEAVPYARLSDPQTLNLYAYVTNNPESATDPDGHLLSFSQYQSQMHNLGGSESGYEQQMGAYDASSAYWAQAMLQQEEAQNTPPANAPSSSSTTPTTQSGTSAQQQNGSSSGGGFWSGLKHGFSNLLHGHSWGYIKATVTAEDVGPHVPVPALTALTDAAGLVSTATKNTPLGVASAVGSVVNDHSAQNVTTNAVGLIPGLGWQTGIMGAFIDFFDYGINNSTPGPKKVGGDPTGPGELQPTLPTQDGGCLAAGSDFPC